MARGAKSPNLFLASCSVPQTACHRHTLRSLHPIQLVGPVRPSQVSSSQNEPAGVDDLEGTGWDDRGRREGLRLGQEGSGEGKSRGVEAPAEEEPGEAHPSPRGHAHRTSSSS